MRSVEPFPHRRSASGFTLLELLLALAVIAGFIAGSTNTQVVPTDTSDSRLNSHARVFHYLPDGSTDLNPTTGHARIYRP